MLNAVEELLVKVSRDGSVLLNPVIWDTFWKPFTDTQPKFAEYLRHMYEEEKVTSPDGSEKYKVYELAREAVLDPSDEMRKATRSFTVEYLQVQVYISTKYKVQSIKYKV